MQTIDLHVRASKPQAENAGIKWKKILKRPDQIRLDDDRHPAAYWHDSDVNVHVQYSLQVTK